MPSPTTVVFEVTITTPPDCGGNPSEEEVREAVYDVCDISATVDVRRADPDRIDSFR